MGDETFFGALSSGAVGAGGFGRYSATWSAATYEGPRLRRPPIRTASGSSERCCATRCPPIGSTMPATPTASSTSTPASRRSRATPNRSATAARRADPVAGEQAAGRGRLGAERDQQGHLEPQPQTSDHRRSTPGCTTQDSRTSPSTATSAPPGASWRSDDGAQASEPSIAYLPDRAQEVGGSSPPSSSP